MKEDIRRYARIGLVHHMLYPKCVDDLDDHVATMEEFIKRDDIETFDCCLPYGKDRQARLIRQIRNCGKSDICFAVHRFPFKKFSLCTTEPNERAQVRLIVADMVEQAVAIGATGFIIASGGPSPAEATDSHRAAFADFCRWLCAELKPHGITVLLEPLDTAVDRRFLYGSTADCVALVRSLDPEVDNLAIELDLAHIPLLGEGFQQAIRTVGPYMKRVHLGNCVLKDKTHPLYGDKHPPIGLKGGEIDVVELTEILQHLLAVGFLNTESRGALLLEITPFPGRSAEETVQDNIGRLKKAWANT
ncbi:MAG: sugar phosphate isomerase/epimerase [Planctomycetes bacterium]|nr:sugar phosphate isomerase/epimerase [Planctomycetota bacterium]